jgi:carotenoid cleavage dioxygenase-like enzyme
MVAAIKHHAPAVDSLTLDMWSKDLPREHGFEALRVEGTLPAALRGTLYRNGPGLFGLHGKRYAHPFEGDGAVTAVRIAGGKATGASRVTPSAGLVAERAAGKMLYGLSAPWPRRVANVLRGKQKNTANTSVVMWQGRLFALNEGNKPTELAPGDLAMIGETDLGTITGAFSAHPHRVESRRAIYNFGMEYGRHSRLHAYALPDSGPAREVGVVDLPAPVMLHDFIATETHLVWFVSPVRVDVPRMLLQLGTFTDIFRWKPEHGTEVICMPIDRPTEVVRFTTEAFYQWHFANAFTRGGELVIDYVRYPNFASFNEIGGYAKRHDGDALAGGRYHRATIDLAKRSLRSEPLVDRECEFPTVAPTVKGREHAVAYATFDNLGALGAIDAKGTIAAHVLDSSERITEPLYVDGHVLALCHTRDAAYVAVYDATRIPNGPVAKIWIDHHVPITFHGVYAPTA